VCAWAMGRLADMPFPGPPLLAVATLPFLFDTSFTIYGGNIPSTLAGEYSFSISLALTLLYFGLLARGLRTGEGRALAAGVLSLAILCHAIPAFFAIAGTVVLLVLNLDWARIKFTIPVLAVGCALAGFWALPFVLRRGYMNDMGFGELTDHGDPLLRPDAQWILALALVGLVLSIAFRIKLGLFLGMLAALYAGAFVINAASPVNIWNARLLPFYYLCLYMLAAIGITEVGRSIGFLAGYGQPDRSMRPVSVAVLTMTVLVTWVLVSLPLRSLPFGDTSADGTTYRWLGLETTNHSFVQSWARWNYNGYERKAAYPEYYAIVTAMDRLGKERGCGRAHWEYEGELDRYGTPMALMLLPFWTDGCIGSSEGLYFESSTTTAFHFLNASEVSAAPSNPQRDLPYSGFDLEDGVAHMRLLGIRYYMAFSAEAISAADERPDLTRVASEPPWSIYEIGGYGVVAPLEYEPAVLADAPTKGEGWLDIAVDWYEDPSALDLPLAASGPESWQRVAVGDEPERRRLPDVVVSNVVEGDLELSFDVDRVGVPVLVRSSYFPNWTASGADGPYRVTPNLMVVVPTSDHVELHYGYTPVDGLGWLLTLAGIAGLVLLRRRGRVELPEQHGPFEGDDFDDLAWLAPSGAEGATEADEADDGAQASPDDGGARRTQLLDPDTDLRDL
jgi:hypothetical protein